MAMYCHHRDCASVKYDDCEYSMSGAHAGIWSRTHRLPERLPRPRHPIAQGRPGRRNQRAHRPAPRERTRSAVEHRHLLELQRSVTQSGEHPVPEVLRVPCAAAAAADLGRRPRPA